MGITIRPATEPDHAGIAIAETDMGPEPVSSSEVREWAINLRKDTEFPVDWFAAVSEPGGFLGWGYCGKAMWLASLEREVHVAVPLAHSGKGVGTLLLNHMEDRLKVDHPSSILCWAMGHDARSMEWAAHRGYVAERERMEGVLDLSAFNAGAYMQVLGRVKAAGIEVRVLWDDAVQPHMRGLYKVDCESFRDVPFRSPGAADPTYETWLLEYEGHSAHRVFAVAFDGGEAVGFTNVWMPQMEGQSAHIGYTGVLRAQRGKGIALALKVMAAAEAARAGAMRIRTGFDPDNPALLHLNKKMGFVPEPGRVIFRKTIENRGDSR